MSRWMRKIGHLGFWLCGVSVGLLMVLVLFHIALQSVPAFSKVGLQMFDPSMSWQPVSEQPEYGLLPMVAGTIYVSALAVLLAMVLGVAGAFFLNFYLPEQIAKGFLSFIDLVAGIPSVIFGFIGLTIVVKGTAKVFGMAAGQSVFSAVVVLGVMLIPFVVSSCSESIEEARKEYELSALTLGFSKEFTIVKIILPAIRRSLIASAMMAFGRGLGETMAVMMVIGNSPIMPKLLGRAQTLPALTALEMGSIEYGSTHLSVLYAANAVLLLVLFSVLACGYFLKRKGRADEQ